MEPAIERDRLTKEICGRVLQLISGPHLRLDDYFKFRARVQKTSLPVLRQILEEDTIGDAARTVLPQRLGAR
jgi:predicted RNA binding protein with dsRBD fold (UPF0201 family)